MGARACVCVGLVVCVVVPLCVCGVCLSLLVCVCVRVCVLYVCLHVLQFRRGQQGVHSSAVNEDGCGYSVKQIGTPVCEPAIECSVFVDCHGDRAKLSTPV